MFNRRLNPLEEGWDPADPEDRVGRADRAETTEVNQIIISRDLLSLQSQPPSSDLMVAVAQSGWDEGVVILLEAKVTPPPLHQASQLKTKTLSRLLHAKADVQEVNSVGKTVLESYLQVTFGPWDPTWKKCALLVSCGATVPANVPLWLRDTLQTDALVYSLNRLTGLPVAVLHFILKELLRR